MGKNKVSTQVWARSKMPIIKALVCALGGLGRQFRGIYFSFSRRVKKPFRFLISLKYLMIFKSNVKWYGAYIPAF